MKRKNLRIFSVAAGLVILAGASPGVRGGAPSEAMDSTRTALAKWMETQQIISKEKRDWQMGKEVLEQRISLLENEIEDLTGKISGTRAGMAGAEGKRRELEGKNEALKAASASLEEFIGELETGTLTLVSRLPNPLAGKLEPLSDQIPGMGTETDLSLSERYQNVIGILNEVNKFNRNILVTSEIQTLPDGSQAEVKAVYIGLGQAYYVTPDGDAAAMGHATPGGWEWVPADHLAEEVMQTVKILQNESVPAYVPLQVEVR